MMAGPSVTIQPPLSTVTLSSLLGLSLLALMTIIYAIIKGKLRPESSVLEARADRDARVAEVRADRDARLEEAARQIETWREAYEIAEGARRSLEALVRDTTLETGRTVQHVVSALQDARNIAKALPPGPDPKENAHHG